jgi:hypothetical protein
MTKTRSRRNESAVVEKTRNEDGLSARRKKQCWTRKIWISLERQTLNGKGKPQHRYAPLGNSGYIQSNPPSSQNSSALSVDIETMANNIESAAWTRSSQMMRNLMRRMSSNADLPDQITTELTSSRTSSRKTN